VRLQRIVIHQLVRDLLRERRFQPAANINFRQFPVFALVVGLKFVTFKIEIGLLDVRLRVDGHVLAGGH